MANTGFIGDRPIGRSAIATILRSFAATAAAHINLENIDNPALGCHRKFVEDMLADGL